jgi:concanavalin A-like lectin/glucanase superfamily protein
MSLLDGLGGAWELEEASGTRIDATANHYDLADNNTVTQQTGKVGNCAQFTRANSESLSLADTDAAPKTNLRGGSAFSIVAWVYFDTFDSGENSPIVNKSDINGAEYELRATGSLNFNAFEISIIQATTGTVSRLATTFGAPSVTTWYMVAATCALGDALKISVNAGVQDSTAINSNALLIGGGSTKASFEIGAHQRDGYYMNGRTDQVLFYNRAITTDEITSLYNGGAGLSYAAMAGGGGPSYTLLGQAVL